MAQTIRSRAIERQETALARLSTIAESAGVLLDRLTSRPDPDAEIHLANLDELLRLLLAAHDLRLLVVSERTHNADT